MLRKCLFAAAVGIAATAVSVQADELRLSDAAMDRVTAGLESPGQLSLASGPNIIVDNTLTLGDGGAPGLNNGQFGNFVVIGTIFGQPAPPPAPEPDPVLPPIGGGLFGGGGGFAAILAALLGL